MTNRRRRWLRRLTIGVSLAAFAAPAAAEAVQPAASGGLQIVSINSGAIVDRTLEPQQPAALRPDDRSDRFTVGQQSQLKSTAVRPDDRADRFAITDGASPATSSNNTSVSWDGAVTFGLGALVLVLVLGLGLGYIRRPRIAGL
jgi:hypothetical protein